MQRGASSNVLSARMPFRASVELCWRTFFLLRFDAQVNAFAARGEQSATHRNDRFGGTLTVSKGSSPAECVRPGSAFFFSHSRSTTGWLFGADEIGCDLIRGVERPLEIAGSAANVAKTACGPLFDGRGFKKASCASFLLNLLTAARYGGR